MTPADEAVRALLRAAGWRAVRAAPVWVSLLILALALIFGGHR